MDKYIYIVVGVIWFLSGIYKAYKKGQAQKVPAGKQERKKSVLETTLDDFLRETEKMSNPAKPVPVAPVKEYNYEKPVSQEMIYDESSSNSENFATEARSLENVQGSKGLVQQAENKSAKKENYDILNSPGLFGTDLKTLFVFSEIIGKPKAFSGA